MGTFIEVHLMLAGAEQEKAVVDFRDTYKLTQQWVVGELQGRRRTAWREDEQRMGIDIRSHIERFFPRVRANANGDRDDPIILRMPKIITPKPIEIPDYSGLMPGPGEEAEEEAEEEGKNRGGGGFLLAGHDDGVITDPAGGRGVVKQHRKLGDMGKQDGSVSLFQRNSISESEFPRVFQETTEGERRALPETTETVPSVMESEQSSPCVGSGGDVPILTRVMSRSDTKLEKLKRQAIAVAQSQKAKHLLNVVNQVALGLPISEADQALLGSGGAHSGGERILMNSVEDGVKESLLSLDVDMAAKEEEECVEIMAWFYIDLGLVTRYNLDLDHLRSWLREAAARHPSHPYHNWQGTTAACQMVYYCMKVCDTQSPLSPAPQDLFALLTSLIEWGCAHPGCGVHLPEQKQEQAPGGGDRLTAIHHAMKALLAESACSPVGVMDSVTKVMEEHAHKVGVKVSHDLQAKEGIYSQFTPSNVVNLERKTASCINELLLCSLGAPIYIPSAAREAMGAETPREASRRNSAAASSEWVGGASSSLHGEMSASGNVDRKSQMETKEIRPFFARIFTRLAAQGTICHSTTIGAAAADALYREATKESRTKWIDLAGFIQQRVRCLAIPVAIIHDFRVFDVQSIQAALGRLVGGGGLPTDPIFA